jgi:hypothetical protein
MAKKDDRTEENPAVDTERTVSPEPPHSSEFPQEDSDLQGEPGEVSDEPTAGTQPPPA